MTRAPETVGPRTGLLALKALFETHDFNALPVVGAGIHEHEKIFGMSITRPEQVDTVLREIVRAAGLNDTGRGIAFVLPVDRVVGDGPFHVGDSVAAPV